MRKVLVILAAAAAICAPLRAQEQLQPAGIDEVIATMSLKEKATVVTGGGFRSMLAGMLGLKAEVPGAAGTTRALEKRGVPATVVCDGPAGVRIWPTRRGTDSTFYCTGFPVGTMLACTWNTELVESVGAAMGNEVLEYGIDMLLGPGMNLQRNPLCGRNFEYYSEDPLVSGKMAAAMVRGIQSNGVGACIKHFAANNQETNRMKSDSQVSDETLRKMYLKGFEIAVKESSPWAVMSSYNKLNGTYTQYSHELLTDILRGEWGFEGFVMTDWTMKRNTVLQIEAGNDLLMPGLNSQKREIVRAVRKDKLDVADLDTCVRNFLNFVIKSPHYQGYSYSNSPALSAHAEIAREAAEEGVVLLKNEDALPLGPSARLALFGVAAYDLIPGGTGSGHVNRPYVVSLAEGLENCGYEINGAVAEHYKKHLKNARPLTGKQKMLGREAKPELWLSRQIIENSVSDCDAAVLVIRRQSGEGGDRHVANDFNLSEYELTHLRDICEAYHEAGKKVIVVINTGGVVETASWSSLPDALLVAWQPGEEGGNALARIISGAVSPSGKLSMTFPVDYFDHPSSSNFPHDYKGRKTMVGTARSSKANVRNVDYTEYAEGMRVGYRHFNTDSLDIAYPFGYGLSYTDFEYSSASAARHDDSLEISVTITNIGKASGKEVVQLYAKPAGEQVGTADSEAWKPGVELVAFAKTQLLAPGESETVVLRFSLEEPASENIYMVGSSSLDLRATVSL